MNPLFPVPFDTAAVAPDPTTPPPDLSVEERDLLDYLHRCARDRPPREWAVFEWHFIEGFTPEEVAMLEQLKLTEVSSLMQLVQQRVREAVRKEGAS